MAREQARVRSLKDRLDTMRKYADSVEGKGCVCDFMTAQNLRDLVEFSRCDLTGALILAARYGHAIGYRTATGEVVA